MTDALQLPAPRLIAITDAVAFGVDHVVERWRLIAEAAIPGSVAVQLRDHELAGRSRYDVGRRLKEIALRAGQLFIVNDRLDIALVLEASGLHLGAASATPRDVRELWQRLGRPRAWLSRAAHRDEAGDEAIDEDVDAWLVSPVAASRKGRPALGMEALTRWRDLAPVQASIYALGGVDAENLAACLAAGADGIAVVQAAFAPRADWSRLLQLLGVERRDSSRPSP